MSNSLPVELSFVIIAYNEENKIAFTLRSILRQTTNLIFEIVVVDDGSKDDTRQVATEILEDYPNHQIITLDENRGRGFARLTGLNAAAGKLIAFVDSDVELPVEWVNRCTRTLEQDHFDAVSGVAIPDGDCVVISRIANLTPKIRKGSAAITGNNLLIRKLVITKVPFPNMRYGDDIRLAWELELAGYKTKCLPDLVVKHSEAKNIRNTLRWQFQQGKDATLLLFQYQKIRIPDFAWFASMLVFLVPFFIKVPFCTSFTIGLILFIYFTSLVFLWTRFKLKLTQLRTYYGVVVNSLFIFSYILGRYVGFLFLPILLFRRAI
jgi:glycosyltransferase involved in cell wall biosynthesis